MKIGFPRGFEHEMKGKVFKRRIQKKMSLAVYERCHSKGGLWEETDADQL
jgi:hypothetical protein